MKITVTCSVCGKEFDREAREVRRSTKLGRKLYCSRQCCGRDNISNLDDTPQYDISPHAANRADDLSPFRWHMRRITDHCGKRKKPEHLNITLEDLKAQWDRQGGICPYTGWQLVQMPNTNTANQLPLTPDRASVDRIDSSKGYEPGNIQFVAFIAQVAKHQFSEDEMLMFCEAVTKNKFGAKSLLPLTS